MSVPVSVVNPAPNIPLVALQNTLQTHCVYNNTVKALLLELSKIPLLSTLRTDLELILHSCKTVETLLKNSPVSVDKTQIVMEAFNTLFPDLTVDEKNLLSVSITFFYNNHQVIIKDKKNFVKVVKSIPKKIFNCCNSI
jgi:hypothetical protein